MTKKQAWTWCSKYIRMRDAIEFHRRQPANPFGLVQCCTCGKVLHWKRMDAGHYFSRGLGGGSGVYFDERNIHTQCKQCNMTGGQIQKYTDFMLERYGQNTIDILRYLDKNRRLKGKIAMIGEMYKQMYKDLEEQKVTSIPVFVDYTVTDECKNPDSYGTICVKCNECGRFTKGQSNGN